MIRSWVEKIKRVAISAEMPDGPAVVHAVVPPTGIGNHEDWSADQGGRLCEAPTFSVGWPVQVYRQATGAEECKQRRREERAKSLLGSCSVYGDRGMPTPTRYESPHGAMADLTPILTILTFDPYFDYFLFFLLFSESKNFSSWCPWCLCGYSSSFFSGRGLL